MELIIDNKVIDAPIPVILDTIRKECGGRFFKDVRARGANFSVTCPCHKNGEESRPSCQVLDSADDSRVERGFFHCFTCGLNLPLYKVVNHCFEEDGDFGKDWLVERFGNTFVEYTTSGLTDINLSKPEETFLDPSILNEFNYYHDYMWERKLSKEVVDEFCVGYNPKTQSLVFPIWDESGRLKMLTERSVNTKRFYIQEDVEKPVYLLNFIKEKGIDKVLVCESQINCLYAWSVGIPAIGLIGTGTPHQLSVLNKSPIRHYVLAFDGDSAGDKGIERFKQRIRKDVFVDVMKIPRGKDLNDLSKEEIENLEIY